LQVGSQTLSIKGRLSFEEQRIKRVNVANSYIELLQKLHASLGIPKEYLEQGNQSLCFQPNELVETEPDYYGRPQRLTQKTFNAWSKMKESAANDNVVFFLVSAFRDPQYQHDLIARKIEKGMLLQEILRVNAAPGFSEHHTGRAIDIGTQDCEVLEEVFEKTAAFKWLQENAENFGFSMSYPRDNTAGFAYEPWHWCFKSTE
jgi:D-alanyl-D-alanine carboxypeptidase